MPYEAITHAAKAKKKAVRNDHGSRFKPLNFEPIDKIRGDVVRLGENHASGWFIVFSTPEGVGRWADVINARLSKLRYKRSCVWVKPDSAPQMNGQGPAAGHESIVCAWAGRGHSRWNGGGKRGVYTHLTNPKNRDGRHPTEKPVALMCELLLDFTQPGDLVFDPFMGSGTTGVACAMTGRQFVGVEINPDYYDVAVERVAKAYEQRPLFAEDAFTPRKAKTADLFKGALS